VRVFKDDPEACPLAITEGPARAWAVAWPEVGAHLRSMHRISLDPGGRTITLSHPMEAVYYLILGSAVVEDLDQGTSDELTQGSMFLVDPGTAYRVVAKDAPAEIVGGPCPPDPSLYAQL
jgi:quercetin dioxygenase-like cupin family protein